MSTFVDIPHSDEGPEAMVLKEKQVRHQFSLVLRAYNQLKKVEERQRAVPKPNQKIRREYKKLEWLRRRHVIRVSQAMQKIRLKQHVWDTYCANLLESHKRLARTGRAHRPLQGDSGEVLL